MLSNKIPIITHWYQHISLISLLMVIFSPLYSWEWSILMGLKWCSHSICGEYFWFQDVVNHFRPMKMRKRHIQPQNTSNVEMLSNKIPIITHWYQHISLISLLVVMVSPLYSWEWSILMGLKWCSHSICGEYFWFQDVVNHFRPMKMVWEWSPLWAKRLMVRRFATIHQICYSFIGIIMRHPYPSIPYKNNKIAPYFFTGCGWLMLIVVAWYAFGNLY